MSTNTNPITYRPLRVALLGNALFSLVSGFWFVAFASAVAETIGSAVPPTVIAVIGAILLPFGSLTAWVGTRPHPPTWAALLISLGDLAWVLASAVLVTIGGASLTFEGALLVIGIALAVLIFALGQLRGIARVYQIPGGEAGRIRVCLEIHTSGDASKVWRNLADLGAIARFAPMLAKSASRRLAGRNRRGTGMYGSRRPQLGRTLRAFRSSETCARDGVPGGRTGIPVSLFRPAGRVAIAVSPRRRRRRANLVEWHPSSSIARDGDTATFCLAGPTSVPKRGSQDGGSLRTHDFGNHAGIARGPLLGSPHSVINDPSGCRTTTDSALFHAQHVLHVVYTGLFG